MRHAPRLPLHVLTTAVLVAGWLAFAPGRAAAECGDHVIVAGQPAQPDPESPPGPRQPCHGPNCSERPAAPLPPVTAPVTNPASQHDAATTTKHDARPSNAGARTALDDVPLPPLVLPAPIYHPPR